jgi:parvulin-like peptidyl-prolyl isomerase
MMANLNSTIATVPWVKPDLGAGGPRLRAARFLTLGFVLAAAAAVVSCKGGNHEDVAAKVGSREITMHQVNTALKQQLDSNGQSNSPYTPSELVAAQLTMLDNMVQEEALFQKAQKDGLVPDDSKVDEAIQTRKQEAKLSEDDYEKKLKESGMEEKELREQVKKELAITALKDKEKTRVKPPTDADISKYYGDHQAQFVAESGVDISTIVTDPANNGAADDAIGDAAAEEKIKAIYEGLKAGADFATVASQRSEDATSALHAGELGFATEAQLRQAFPTRPDLPARLMAMSAGQYTEPLKDTISGRWYIIKVNGKREQTQNLTLKDVREKIIDVITQQRQQVLLNALIMATMADTSLKNYLADRIVQNPETLTMVKPSELLNPVSPQQPQPRIENDNSAPGTAGAGASKNSNKRAAPAGKP